jgi:hypothetical protein
LDSIE